MPASRALRAVLFAAAGTAGPAAHAQGLPTATRPAAESPVDPKAAETHVLRLRSIEPAQREDARRRLAWLPHAALPVQALLECVRAAEEGAAAAAWLLARQPELHDALRREVDAQHAPLAVLAASLPALSGDQLWSIVAAPVDDADGAAARRSRERDDLVEDALAELARRGELLVPRLADVLGHEVAVGPAVFAAELLVHGPLPSAPLLDAIGRAPAGRQRVMRALADHPRADWVPWLNGWIENGQDATSCLHAIAALPRTEHTPAHARTVLRLLDGETQPFLADFAAARFSSRIADGLVAAAHAAVVDGKRIADLLPLLTNVSGAGEEHLLGLALTLTDDDEETVCRWLDVRDAPVLTQRIESALDGLIPLETQWLQRAGPHLTTPARVARVAAVLDEPAPRREAAFDALVEANRYDERMLALLAPGDAAAVTRARELLRLRRGVLPDAVALGLLAHADASVRLAAVHYLATENLGEAVADALARRLAADPDDRVRAVCARALTSFAGRERAADAFAAALGSAFGEEAVEWLIARPRPFGRDLLGAALSIRQDQRQLDDLESGLVRLGDLRPLPGLLARIDELPLRLVRRIAPALGAVEDEAILHRARSLAADSETNEIVREALVSGLALRPDAHIEFLQALFAKTDDDGVRSAALAGLLRTPAGDAMLARLTERIGQQPLLRADEDLAFELLNAAPMPLPAPVVELAARLVLLAPLASPTAEAELTLADRGPGADYPLVQPLAELIRRDPRADHGETIARVVEEARRHPQAHALSRRRLGHLLAYLTFAEAACAAAAPALARALVEAPDVDTSWLGPAWLVLARDAEAEGDLTSAADAFERAHRACVHHPRPSLQRRRFLPDPDPADGFVPLGALAARSDLLRARLAHGQGDRPAALAALAHARVRASADAATLREIDALEAEVRRP